MAWKGPSQSGEITSPLSTVKLKRYIALTHQRAASQATRFSRARTGNDLPPSRFCWAFEIPEPIREDYVLTGSSFPFADNYRRYRIPRKSSVIWIR